MILLEFSQVKISVCPRSCNRVADGIAAFGPSLVEEGSKLWLNQFPDFVMNSVTDDLFRNIG